MNPDFNYIEQIVGGACSEQCHDVISHPDGDDPTKFDKDYRVEAQACGHILKKEQVVEGKPSSWSCEAWQITLLKKTSNGGYTRRHEEDDDGDEKKKGLKGTKGDKKKNDGLRKLKLRKGDMRRDLRREKKHEDEEYLVVLTLTYSDLFDTRHDAVAKCPDKAVYRADDIIDSEYGIGSIQLVLQTGYGGNDHLEPCTWDCFQDHHGIC